jgi:hypothetical protein
MRIRPISYWQRRLLFGLSILPKNEHELSNLAIAEFFTKVKNNHPNKVDNKLVA